MDLNLTNKDAGLTQLVVFAGPWALQKQPNPLKVSSA
jgi:hypothetical protein